MTPRALITGAGGFVGTRLASHLLEQGWQVAEAVFPHEGRGIPCDVTEPESIEAAFEQAGEITHVFHLAALTFVPDAVRNPALAFRVNMEGTVNIANHMQICRPKARLLFIGSADAYGPPDTLPLTEEHPLRPQNPYAVSKAAADHFCAFLSRTGSLDVVRMRPFNHSGAGQSAQFVLSSFARQAAAVGLGLQEPVVHVGNLSAKRDFLHVDDVVRAYELAAREGQPGAAYNVASGQAYQIEEALEKLLSFCGKQVEVRHDPARMRPVDVPEFRGSAEALAGAAGWRPEIPFESMLRELYEYWRETLALESGRA